MEARRFAWVGIRKGLPGLGRSARAFLERVGLLPHLAHPPGHYYSPIPSISELRKQEPRIWPSSPPRSLPGIELNEELQLHLLREFARYQEEQPFPDEKTPGRRFFFRNDFYSYSDAIFLYSMIRHLQPRRIVEIGSGYSSALMLDVNELYFQNTMELTFIDPEPARLLFTLREGDIARIISKRVQDVELRLFEQLEPGDILFVDSSHVTKTGSDVNYLFFEVIPRLSTGSYIHVHDIFYPFEYPREYVYSGWAWNEAYLLRAFLSYNREFEIVLFPACLEAFHNEELRQSVPLASRHPPNWPSLCGAAIWLRRNPQADVGPLSITR